MLAQRLDKLENDLQFLIAMQDLLLDKNDNDIDVEPTFKNASASQISNLLRFTDEIPERDGACVTRSKKLGKPNMSRGGGCLSSKQVQVQKETLLHKDALDEPHPQLTSDTQEKLSTNSLQASFGDVGKTAIKIAEDMENEKRSLKEQLEQERSLRKETEESAKQVYIKLQKVKDELDREKEMKESLLIGTLELKNLVHGYDSRINELSVDLSESKAEVHRLNSEIHSLSSENINVIQHLKQTCHELGFKNDHNMIDFHGSYNPLLYFDFIKNQIQLLKRSASEDTNTNSEQVRKITGQLNTVVGRCAKLEKERETITAELNKCQDREEHLKQQLHMSQMALTTMESELLKKQIEYECTIQKLQSNLQIDKEKATIKISEYSSVIQRTKDLLVTLRNERDDSRKQLQETRSLNHNLELRLKAVEGDKRNLADEIVTLKHRCVCITREKTEVLECVQNEKVKLEMSLKKAVGERRKCMELLGEMKHQIVSLKNKCEHDSAMFSVEKERILNENKRLDENFRVLQKVSEDQGRTIQKLRGDLEHIKESNFQLESQIRDHESNENSLIRKLEQCEKQCDKYARYISELEDKVEKYSEEMRLHDCDDYADSRYKKKFKEVEDLLREKSKEWEELLKELENEKEEAISTARKAIKKVEEMKDVHESAISEIKSKLKTEVEQLVDQQKKQTLEKCTKIQELQSELDRMKLSSSQIQRALSTKIQQLQSALSICLGGSTSPNNNSSTLGLGLLHHLHHQNNLPSAASTNGAFGYGSNPFANSVLNNNTGGQRSHQSFETCFANSNVDGCAAGLTINQPSGTCPASTTGNFSVDFTNLIL